MSERHKKTTSTNFPADLAIGPMLDVPLVRDESPTSSAIVAFLIKVGKVSPSIGYRTAAGDKKFG
jgi:hypothetical protein